jgi:hypothetical protein
MKKLNFYFHYKNRFGDEDKYKNYYLFAILLILFLFQFDQKLSVNI